MFKAIFLYEGFKNPRKYQTLIKAVYNLLLLLLPLRKIKHIQSCDWKNKLVENNMRMSKILTQLDFFHLSTNTIYVLYCLLEIILQITIAISFFLF